MMEKGVSEFFETTAPGGSLERLAVAMCRIGGTLAAVLTLVIIEAYLRPERMLSLKPSSFLASMEVESEAG